LVAVKKYVVNKAQLSRPTAKMAASVAKYWNHPREKAEGDGMLSLGKEHFFRIKTREQVHATPLTQRNHKRGLRVGIKAP